MGGPRKPPPHLPLTPCLQPVYSPQEETQPAVQLPEHPSADRLVKSEKMEVEEAAEQTFVVSIVD
nr:unnamed protein product [Callosobruchus analis]